MPLPEPKGRQLDVLYLLARGHTVVLGTAGSGKTLMAVLRARHLADTSTDHAGPTLLVTFNKALVAYIKAMAPPGLANVRIETFHRFAAGYLASLGMMGPRDIAQGAGRDRLVEGAVEAVRPTFPGSPFDRPTRWFVDEFEWMCGNGHYDRSEYTDPERVQRVGRKTPLRSAQRDAVFSAFEGYRHARQKAGYPYDWADVASHVRSQLASDVRPRRYRHIVVDECQDFSPEMLRAVVDAADPEGSVTIFGDYAQQIYGQRFSWRSVRLSVPRGVVQFVDNYRNTAEIARLAIAIAGMDYFRDEADLVEPSSPTASGPKPALVRCRDRAHEADFAVAQAIRLGATASVAVLYRDRNRDEPEIRKRLPEAAIRLSRDMTSWSTSPGVRYGTYHSAKGLEFDHVVLAFCGSDRLPEPDLIEAFGMDDAMGRDGRLVYVGVTRARSGLIITYHGGLTLLLPRIADLYTSMTAP